MRLRKLTDWLCYDVPQGIRGVLYWLPYAWTWRPWDYQYGLEALERHFIKLEVCCRTGWGANAEQHARDIRIAISLIRRMREGSYSDHPEVDDLGRSVPPSTPWWERQQQDWDFLFEHMRKHMQRWWD
jgi:hypothetical protein